MRRYRVHVQELRAVVRHNAIRFQDERHHGPDCLEVVRLDRLADTAAGRVIEEQAELEPNIVQALGRGRRYRGLQPQDVAVQLPLGIPVAFLDRDPILVSSS